MVQFLDMGDARTGGVAQRRPAARLPRGRHQLTREAVAAAQRSRLLDGVAEAVAAKGYAAATIGDVVAASAVSRRTFYEQFNDIESCFLAAYQAGMELLLSEIRSEVRRHPDADWRTRARVSVEAYLRELAARPAAAWAYSIEALGAGPAVLEHRSRILGRWVAQWRGLLALARDEDPALAEINDDHLLLLVGGIEELVRECLRTRGAEHLPELADRLTAIGVSTLGG
jgi:AcrR family transcriptional regulator